MISPPCFISMSNGAAFISMSNGAAFSPALAASLAANTHFVAAAVIPISIAFFKYPLATCSPVSLRAFSIKFLPFLVVPAVKSTYCCSIRIRLIRSLSSSSVISTTSAAALLRAFLLPPFGGFLPALRILLYRSIVSGLRTPHFIPSIP